LNGVMAVTLSYFTEFGKPVFQHIGGLTASICGGIYVAYKSIVFCSACTVYDVVRKEVHVRDLIF